MTITQFLQTTWFSTFFGVGILSLGCVGIGFIIKDMLKRDKIYRLKK